MSWNNAIPRANLPISYEGSPLHSLRESNGVLHDWKRILAANRRGDLLTNFSSQVMRKINQAPRPDFSFSNLHPFKLYNFPQSMRQKQNDDDWRRVKVRFGLIGYGGSIGIPYGTDLDPSDEFDISPSDEVFLKTEVPPPTNAAVVPTGPGVGWHEFIVPDDGMSYAFWVSLSLTKIGEPNTVGVMAGKTNTNATSLQSGNTGLNDDWPEFPTNDPYHFLLGYATAIQGNLKLLQVQYDNNIPFWPGRGTGVETGEASLRLRGPYQHTLPYYVGDVVTVKDASNPPFSYASDMEILYALFPKNPGDGGVYDYDHGPVSGVDPGGTNTPDPWILLSPIPQVYTGPNLDPSLTVAPYDGGYPALYYQQGAAVLWGWVTSTQTWSRIV